MTGAVCRTYSHKDMTTKEAIPDVTVLPSCAFFVKKGWPLFCNQRILWVGVLEPADSSIEERVR